MIVFKWTPSFEMSLHTQKMSSNPSNIDDFYFLTEMELKIYIKCLYERMHMDISDSVFWWQMGLKKYVVAIRTVYTNIYTLPTTVKCVRNLDLVYR